MPIARTLLGPAALCLLSPCPADALSERYAVEPPPAKGIPHLQTLHKRLLRAQVVVVARCTKVQPKEKDKVKNELRWMTEGNSFRLVVKRVRKVKASSTDQGAYLTLVRSRDRSALLAAIRLAFMQKDAAKTWAMLAIVKNRGGFSPAAASNASGEEMLAAWQEHWRKYSKSMKAAFPNGTVDQLLGTAKGWSSFDK